MLDLTLHNVRSGKLVKSVVLTRRDALALADEAAARILAAANVTDQGAQLAELETLSVEAYQHYMKAQEAGRAGRVREALSELDAAVALDSGFITALRDRIGLAVGVNDTALTRRLRETLRRHADREPSSIGWIRTYSMRTTPESVSAVRRWPARWCAGTRVTRGAISCSKASSRDTAKSTRPCASPSMPWSSTRWR